MSTPASNSGYLNMYMLIAVGHLVALTLGYDQAAMISKVLLMPALMLHVFRYAVTAKQLKNWLLMVLFFSWLGDILLMFDDKNPDFFIYGLGAFLIAQACYIKTFSIAMRTRNGNALPFWILLFPLLYAGILLSVLIPHLGDMMIPVVLYALVITGMLIQALRRWSKTGKYSYWFVVCGAIVFIASDSMIAIDAFYSPIEFASLLIMITYIIAQFLLVSGLLLHEQEEINPAQSGQ